MAENTWKPVDADNDGSEIQIVFQNENGEEYIHVTDLWGSNYYYESSPHELCWNGCSCDWPGCKATCPLFVGPMENLAAEEKKYHAVGPADPFSFTFNRRYTIDDNNFYVESFDAVDGSHWEIAVDISDQIQEYFDQRTQQEETYDGEEL